MLLHKATFSDASEVPVSSSIQSVIKSITSFDTWMQAWNIYLVVLLAHNPSRAVELFGYQRLTYSANTLLPVHSWLQYDSTFRTLAAANPLLRWDQRHPDFWLECLASGQQNKHWPGCLVHTTELQTISQATVHIQNISPSNLWYVQLRTLLPSRLLLSTHLPFLRR